MVPDVSARVKEMRSNLEYRRTIARGRLSVHTAQIQADTERSRRDMINKVLAEAYGKEGAAMLPEQGLEMADAAAPVSMPVSVKLSNQIA